MAETPRITYDQARQVGRAIGMDWAAAPFDVEQFRTGISVELEHGLRDPATDVTGDDPRSHWQDRARASERVPRLLHAPRTDGGGGDPRRSVALIQAQATLPM
jgi:hypothetical protein